jgi:hypothetical protein
VSVQLLLFRTYERTLRALAGCTRPLSFGCSVVAPMDTDFHIKFHGGHLTDLRCLPSGVTAQLLPSRFSYVSR